MRVTYLHLDKKTIKFHYFLGLALGFSCATQMEDEGAPMQKHPLLTNCKYLFVKN